jgi:hypothetical protein
MLTYFHLKSSRVNFQNIFKIGAGVQEETQNDTLTPWGRVLR